MVYLPEPRVVSKNRLALRIFIRNYDGNSLLARNRMHNRVCISNPVENVESRRGFVKITAAGNGGFLSNVETAQLSTVIIAVLRNCVIKRDAGIFREKS